MLALAGWWRTPDTIINDLNINSAISRPGHDEIIPLGKDLPYTMKGYAYTGGGRRLTRVEISMDEGATWKLAKINRCAARQSWDCCACCVDGFDAGG